MGVGPGVFITQEIAAWMQCSPPTEWVKLVTQKIFGVMTFFWWQWMGSTWSKGEELPATSLGGGEVIGKFHCSRSGNWVARDSLKSFLKSPRINQGGVGDGDSELRAKILKQRGGVTEGNWRTYWLMARASKHWSVEKEEGIIVWKWQWRTSRRPTTINILFFTFW